MKLLTICQYYYPEEFRINDICESLAQNKSYEITCLTGLPNYPKGEVLKDYKWFKKRKEVINKVNVIRCFEIGRRKGIFFRILNYMSFMLSSTLKAIFLKKDFDLVYVYQLSPIFMAIPGIVYKKIHKKKLILYVLDLWPESVTTFGIKKDSFIYKIIDKISRKIYNCADTIIVSSEMFKEEIKKKLKSDIEILYMPQYTTEILEKNKKENDYCNIVFAGNVGKAQSIDTIVKAANILKKDTSIKIHIVGDGSELAETKKLVEQYDLENIIFHGRKSSNEMQQYYDLADAMLVTLTKDEFAAKTLPGKVQTCMLTGNAIIAAANGETKNVIEKSKCGLCVNAEDYEALANAILSFDKMTDEEKKCMRDNSYKYYENNYKKEKFMDKLIKILEKEGRKNV